MSENAGGCRGKAGSMCHEHQLARHRSSCVKHVCNARRGGVHHSLHPEARLYPCISPPACMLGYRDVRTVGLHAQLLLRGMPGLQGAHHRDGQRPVAHLCAPGQGRPHGQILLAAQQRGPCQYPPSDVPGAFILQLLQPRLDLRLGLQARPAVQHGHCPVAALQNTERQQVEGALLYAGVATLKTAASSGVGTACKLC